MRSGAPATRSCRASRGPRPGSWCSISRGRASLNARSETCQLDFRSGNYAARLNSAKENRMFRLACLLLASAVALPLHAQIPVKIYGQELIDRVVAKNPDLLVAVMHVTPPKSADNVIIASNIGRIGKPGDEDDMRVINTGKSNLEVGQGGDRFEVELVLRDGTGGTIGALGLVWPYKAEQDKAALEKKAERIRDALAKRILNAANLMDPFPLDARATTKTHAQKLVDQAAAKHPELTVLALRGPAGKEGELRILGSTFGPPGHEAHEPH